MRASRRAFARFIVYMSSQGYVDILPRERKSPRASKPLGADTILERLDWLPLQYRYSIAQLFHFALAVMAERVRHSNRGHQIPIEHIRYWLVEDMRDFLGDYMAIQLRRWLFEVKERVENLEPLYLSLVLDLPKWIKSQHATSRPVSYFAATCRISHPTKPSGPCTFALVTQSFRYTTGTTSSLTAEQDQDRNSGDEDAHGGEEDISDEGSPVESDYEDVWNEKPRTLKGQRSEREDTHKQRVRQNIRDLTETWEDEKEVGYPRIREYPTSFNLWDDPSMVSGPSRGPADTMSHAEHQHITDDYEGNVSDPFWVDMRRVKQDMKDNTSQSSDWRNATDADEPGMQQTSGSKEGGVSEVDEMEGYVEWAVSTGGKDSLAVRGRRLVPDYESTDTDSEQELGRQT